MFDLEKLEQIKNSYYVDENLVKNLVNNPFMNYPSIKGYFEDLDKERKERCAKIWEGLEKDTAGTGIPMTKLKGGAREQAERANIGGGSIENGGNGTKGGDKTIYELIYDNGRRRGAEEMLDIVNKINNDKNIITIEDYKYLDDEEFYDFEDDNDYEDYEFDDCEYDNYDEFDY